MAPKPRKRPTVRRRSERSGVRMLAFLFTVLALALLVVAAPALIVLFVGMIPTAVALLIDRDPRKYAAISVAAMNFAGVSPYLVDLVLGQASFGRAIALVSDVFVLVVMYGAAAAAWVLLLALPPITAIVLGAVAESRIQAVRKEQQQLIEDWGEGVARR